MECDCFSPAEPSVPVSWGISLKQLLNAAGGSFVRLAVFPLTAEHK